MIDSPTATELPNIIGPVAPLTNSQACEELSIFVMKKEYQVDVLLVYDPAAPMEAVAAKVAQLTDQGNTVSAQKNIPPRLRYRQLIKLSKEGSVC